MLFSFYKYIYKEWMKLTLNKELTIPPPTSVNKEILILFKY